MSEPIDFSEVGRYRKPGDGVEEEVPHTYTTSEVITYAEPIWKCEDGALIPISQLNDKHLQRIERWLRGGGATQPAQGAADTWYATIKAEFDKRKLAMLVDHPEAKAANNRSKEEKYRQAYRSEVYSCHELEHEIHEGRKQDCKVARCQPNELDYINKLISNAANRRIDRMIYENIAEDYGKHEC